MPAILRLLADRPPSGRYRAENLLAESTPESPPEATFTASGGLA